MTAITAGAESPNILKKNWEVVQSFLAGRIFAWICFVGMWIYSIVTWAGFGYANNGPSLIGSLVAAATFALTWLIIGIAVRIRDSIKSMPRRKRYYDFPFEAGWQAWTAFGPTFAVLFMMSFVFYPMTKTVLVINGEVLTKATFLNPWNNEVIAINKTQKVATSASANTKDGRRVQGWISATCILTDDSSKWKSDDEVNANATKEVKRSFNETVGRMNIRDLDHTIEIEAVMILNTRLNEYGLRLEPGSTVEAGGIHAAVPGS